MKASLRATYRLAGASPQAFHLGNVLAHALAALLLATVALGIAGPVPALVTGAVFAVHPMTVQAVSIVTARSDVFAALFTFAAFVAVLRYGKTGSAPALMAILAFELLAFGSRSQLFSYRSLSACWPWRPDFRARSSFASPERRFSPRGRSCCFGSPSST